MKRSKHTLSNYKLFTCDMGQLVPIGLTEVLPGDTFQHSTSLLLRMSPMIAPVMHPITVRVHHFFVPNRLVWEGWEDFITAGPEGTDASTIPQHETPSGIIKNTIWDYYGVRDADLGSTLSSLPYLGYNAIFNEYYRDQDLDKPPVQSSGVRQVNWEKDYFTTSRPWEQKGDSVTIPLGAEAPIHAYATRGGQESLKIRDVDGTPSNLFTDTDNLVKLAADGSGEFMYADLSSAEAVNINEFRRAFALQRYAEARARYGSRYTEYLRYLGIRPSDARLQRPEYLGGGRVNVSISEVLQTAPEPEGPGVEYGVGDMFGHGIAAMRSNKYRRFFEEHGYIHSLMSVVPKAMYADGVERHFLKTEREDFFQKELAHIGQQEIMQGEVYLGGGSDRDTVFGYQDRYDEYRSSRSTIAGDFRDTLNYWHLARQFQDEPVLNESFVQCIPSKRIFAEQTQHSLWCMAQHKMVARRLVPKRATSRII